jgi:hypothetical protein
MAPIYKLWMSRPTEAGWHLSEQEGNAVMAKIADLVKQCGGKSILQCDSAWSNEQWTGFGVEEWPDIEALQKYTALLYEKGIARYAENWSMLGIKWPSS